MTYPNLKAELARKGLKADDVAIAASVSGKTVYNWLKGTSEPTIGQAKAIRARLFPDLDLSYLFE